jgi:hypothetical protein
MLDLRKEMVNPVWEDWLLQDKNEPQWQDLRISLRRHSVNLNKSDREEAVLPLLVRQPSVDHWNVGLQLHMPLVSEL